LQLLVSKCQQLSSYQLTAYRVVHTQHLVVWQPQCTTVYQPLPGQLCFIIVGWRLHNYAKADI
jgi:hypothetical protein